MTLAVVDFKQLAESDFWISHVISHKVDCVQIWAFACAILSIYRTNMNMTFQYIQASYG